MKKENWVYATVFKMLQNWRGSLRFLPPLEMRPSSIATNPVEFREAPPTPQRPSPLRGTLGSSLRSPAEVEGNESPRATGISGLHYRLTRGVRPPLEGNQRTPLSSRVATRISWSPLVASMESSLLFILERGLGIVLQAMQEKKALHLARTGASQGLPRAAAPVGVFS